MHKVVSSSIHSPGCRLIGLSSTSRLQLRSIAAFSTAQHRRTPSQPKPKSAEQPHRHAAEPTRRPVPVSLVKQHDAAKEASTTPSSLRALPPASHRLPLRRMDWEEVTSAFSRCRIQHASPLFTLKVIPSSSIPAIFSLSALDHRNPFAIVTSIKSISKKAVIRNRVRTRFKEAIRLVVTRDVDVGLQEKTCYAIDRVLLPDNDTRKEWLIPNHHYIAYPSKAVYDVPMPELIRAVRTGLQDLFRKHLNSRPPSKKRPGERSVTPAGVKRRTAG